MSARDWPFYVGALGVAGAIAWLMARGEPVSSGRTTPKAAEDAPDTARGRIVGDGPIVAFPGMTYFVAVETNGSVDSVATVARVKAKAEAEGFRDVMVEEERPELWPITSEGDYFVRATFRGEAPKAFPRHVGVFMGSANLLDAVEV